jgi:hypothetical protein
MEWAVFYQGSGKAQSVYWLGYGPIWSVFDSRQGQVFLVFVTASRPDLDPTQHPVQWVTWAPSPEVKWSGREYGHSPPSSAEVKNAWSYTSTSPYAFTTWCLPKPRDKFIVLPCSILRQMLWKYFCGLENSVFAESNDAVRTSEPRLVMSCHVIWGCCCRKAQYSVWKPCFLFGSLSFESRLHCLRSFVTFLCPFRQLW